MRIMIVDRVKKILIEKGILTTTMTRMNPLSDRYLAVESLIFSRSTIEFYRNRGTLPHELPPITFLWVQQPLLCELVTPRGVS